MFWGQRMSADDVKAMIAYAKGEKGRLAKYVMAMGVELLRRMKEAKKRELRRKR